MPIPKEVIARLGHCAENVRDAQDRIREANRNIYEESLEASDLVLRTEFVEHLRVRDRVGIGRFILRSF